MKDWRIYIYVYVFLIKGNNLEGELVWNIEREGKELFNGKELNIYMILKFI